MFRLIESLKAPLNKTNLLRRARLLRIDARYYGKPFDDINKLQAHLKEQYKGVPQKSQLNLELVAKVPSKRLGMQHYEATYVKILNNGSFRTRGILLNEHKNQRRHTNLL